MTKYALGYADLCKVRPDLIMVSLPGYGRSGPHGRFVSFGGPLMAYSGMSLLWGYADSPPNARVKVAQPDYISAATQALAVTAALHHRARTGEDNTSRSPRSSAAAISRSVYLDYFANGTVAEPEAIATPPPCHRAVTPVWGMRPGASSAARLTPNGAPW
jgi:crotonobetainyl-CoA:carnitine CoA-transferase CaiB-like acyl-CoA transferase